MLKVFRYLKGSVISLIAVIALLFGQAYCDLALPEYTARIVNVGIQQNGFDYASPKYISKASLDNALLFVSDDEHSKILDNYILESSFTPPKAFFFQKDSDVTIENVYVIKDISKADRDALDLIIAKPLLMLYGIQTMGQAQGIDTSAIFGQLAMVGYDDRMKMIDAMQEQAAAQNPDEESLDVSTLSESMMVQAATAFSKAEYENLKIDTGDLQIEFIVLAGLQMLALALLGMIASVLVTLLSARIAAKLGWTLRGKVFKKVIGFSNQEFDKFSTASLITRSTNDITQVQMMMIMLFRIVVYAPIMAIGGVLKVSAMKSSMSWVIAVGVGALLLLVGTLFAVVMPKFKVMQKLIDRLNLVSREILTGLPVIRAFNKDRFEEKRFDGANTDLMKNNMFVNRAMTLMFPTMMLIMNAITILIIWVGAGHIDMGNLQVGDMMAFMTYAMQIIMSFLMLSMVSIMLPRALVSVKRIFEVLDTKTFIHDPASPKSFSGSRKGVLEFRNVTFRYPNAEEDVLHEINFTAKPGETTAIIGGTGSGKSTLLNLIPRFYDVTKGEILLDGTDIREVKQHDLREKLGLVPQKGVLFTGTIESNIKFGLNDLSDAEIADAATVAQAADFIAEKEKKYADEISQGGTNVSGGQKQRLSIARAIAKKPDVFLFDDSFSALDYQTDVALRSALKSKTANSTVIIIAQRISTIIHAEQIIVLEEGKIVGKGRHEELLKSCEVYREIASSQFSKEELGL